MNITSKIKELINNQYSQPKGIVGMYFGEKMAIQHRPEAQWTIELLNIQQNESILELGCGAGYAMKLLLRQSAVSQVVGLDISPDMLRSASIRNQKEIKRGRAKLVQGNVEKLNFEDECFTKAFSIHSVYFWDNLPETISEIYRVLKPQGSLILTLCDGKNGESWNNKENLLEQKVIPIMKATSFKNIAIVNGPDSRQFHTIAVTADK